jgi:hypothetical protein
MHGPGDNTKDIYVNGKKMQIRQNLFDFLGVLQRNGSRWGDIWVDQISIWQENTLERSAQVKHLGEIYRRAKEVVVWLGRGLQSDALALDLILRTFELEVEQRQQAELTPHELNLLRSFMRIPYFGRLWAIQELVLARDITILVSDGEIRWDVVISVYSRHVFVPNLSSLRDTSEDCTSLQRIHLAKGNKGILDIFDVINGFCKYECSDPRDKLYGLFGLLDKRSGLSLDVDYSLYLEAVFCNFCWQMLNTLPETEQLFDILVMLGHAMGLETIFHADCTEGEIWGFFRNNVVGTEPGRVKVLHGLQSKAEYFLDAARFLTLGVQPEYDMLSGKRILPADMTVPG